jgi:hypothetical protein
MSDDECPPLNAISLPASRRNLYIPSQFGSLASHEVAQSRLPTEYESSFDVPDMRSHMEWSLIGGRGAISPLHVDSDGLGTTLVVLEGSKYWIMATRLGEHDFIFSVDSLGPAWNPYFINDGDNVDRFRFEGVHLQKGNMLCVVFLNVQIYATDNSSSIMPGGVPHWVLGTSNSICVGRHFYSTSSIRSSVIGIVHTFLLDGSVTNEVHIDSRSLLCQLMVFWSSRIDKSDMDGEFNP